VNEEKNAARERAIKPKPEEPRMLTNYIPDKREREREEIVHKKARQLDEDALIEIERHRSIQDSRKFYKRPNDARRPFERQVDMCRAKNGELFNQQKPSAGEIERTF
jgi:hypothetical protein